MDFNSKELEEYMDRFRRDALPHLENSAFVLIIAPDDKNADLKLAIEVGCAILFDKPLVDFKGKDRTVSARLRAIADHVIEGDLETDRERMYEELKNIILNVKDARNN